ncbi:MAG TPA: lanthionine synthetase LanC family protein [Longimicrobium sp.]|nr:lanthionine synthetase LanC family protein [Longimicrobium sp.]
MTDFALETAARIGERLARTEWRGDACAWTPEHGATPGELYRGTAGIALFLGELAPYVGDASVATAARGAARHALAWAEAVDPRHIALFTGRLGVAYAAARTAARLGREDVLGGARSLVRASIAAPAPRAYDVVDGAAGAVLALLALEPLLGVPECRDAAVRIGQSLLQRAVDEPLGWSWTAGGEPFVRNLVGYGHGASGVGHALLELFVATGDEAFRHGAEQAWLYERRFQSAVGHWPDFRYPAGWDGAYLPRHTCAWCHGAPGIILARCGANVPGFEIDRTGLAAAAGAVRARVRDDGGNFSLCHGIAGLAEALMGAAAPLDDPTLRDEAESAAARGWERFERAGRPWPCGTRGGAWDPGLMLGEAGIGLFYLRLHDPAVPSIVLLRPSSTPARVAAGDAGAHRPSIRATASRFALASASLARLPGDAWSEDAPPFSAHAAYVALLHRVEHEADPVLRALMADAFAVERARHEMEMGVIDRGEERRDAPAGDAPAASPASDGEPWVRLSDHARLVITDHDWEACLRTGAGETPPGPAAYVLVRQANAVRAHRLSPLAAAVLEALRVPRTPAGVAQELAASFAPGEGPSEDALRGPAAAQLGALERLGAVVREPRPPLEGNLDRIASAAAGTLDAPAAVRARWKIARRVEVLRRHVDGPDAVMAELAARRAAADLARELRFVHAEPLFAHLIERCHAARAADERITAARALLDALDRSFASAFILVDA